MKRFLFKLIVFLFLLYSLTMILVYMMPKDEDGYLCEYNCKVEILKNAKQPRIIFIGGSNLAFSLDSKMVMDSLKRNVVNFGLHGGIGIRFPIKDCLQYVQKGDIIVFQMEYEFFFNGGKGEIETLPQLIYYTNYRNTNLSFMFTENFLFGFPRIAIHNLRKVVSYFSTGSFKIPSMATGNNSYNFTARGFNQYGDEVRHLNYPNIPFEPITPKNRSVDYAFIKWLDDVIDEYEQKGAKVILLPPVCIKSFFQSVYSDDIEKSLNSINHSYFVSPEAMVLDDSCSFDSGYHMNKEGVRQNTTHIIDCLKYVKNTKYSL